MARGGTRRILQESWLQLARLLVAPEIKLSEQCQVGAVHDGGGTQHRVGGAARAGLGVAEVQDAPNDVHGHASGHLGQLHLSDDPANKSRQDT